MSAAALDPRRPGLDTHERLVRCHPLNLLSAYVGRLWALAALMFAFATVAVVADVNGHTTVAGVVALAFVAAVAFHRDPQPTTREERETRLQAAADAYAAGELTHPEFEQRVGFILDDRAQEIRRRVEGAQDVGPERSAAIAAHFDDVDELLRADVDDLADAHGVGPATAEKVLAHLQRQPVGQGRP